jgi:eukaryotic-like serine/threonine-protein kinase
VYVVASRSGRSDNALYALDAATGDEKWTFEPGQYLSGPTISEGVLYLSGGYELGKRGTIFALDAATGKELKRMDFKHGLSGPPVIHQGVLYVTGHSTDDSTGILLAIE